MTALCLAAFVIYAPFGWLFMVGDDASYVSSWLVRYPVLPGLAPSFMVLSPFNTPLGSLPDWLAVLMMFSVTAIMLSATAWSASRSRRAFILTMLGALLLSVLNSWCAYNIFSA